MSSLKHYLRFHLNNNPILPMHYLSNHNHQLMLIRLNHLSRMYRLYRLCRLYPWYQLYQLYQWYLMYLWCLWYPWYPWFLWYPWYLWCPIVPLVQLGQLVQMRCYPYLARLSDQLIRPLQVESLGAALLFVGHALAGVPLAVVWYE